MGTPAGPGRASKIQWDAIVCGVVPRKVYVPFQSGHGGPE